LNEFFLAKIKMFELRKKDKTEILKQLDEFKKELAQLRIAKVTGGAPSKLAKIKFIRRSIARVLTVINQNRKLAVRKVFAGKKYKPLDLRQKKTRAIRRKLTITETRARTLKFKKKRTHFPRRKFAVKP